MASKASDKKPMLARASPVFPPKGAYSYFSRRSPSASVLCMTFLFASWRKKEAPAASVVGRARDIGDGAEAVL